MLWSRKVWQFSGGEKKRSNFTASPTIELLHSLLLEGTWRRYRHFSARERRDGFHI
jgi:hypothetical protein